MTGTIEPSLPVAAIVSEAPVNPPSVSVSSGSVNTVNATSEQTPRAIGSEPAEQQLVETTTNPPEDQDYDLPVGLLSTVVSTEIQDTVTTVFSTDVFGNSKISWFSF